ncbi:serine/threonine-protein phosphatase 2A activator-like isoform X2 [Sitodiplosis mosellana]|uniref:serine/threonine-protein phosphatase 2A activator-like isoform X2 n=1 Tax=Sitodiplosis mosellana TaxID=263140 RepID=UPI002444754D|nr:serine/threonine-protein phosphatase 2A activator-like isoform X2 [Sitodiplosis mosellana]XP_055325927.1 serine/threonine-protein phosphatase 2A activator-like isoform X2 [Sitodiplosis mosellana]XP_055326177.1 serine/threonine-protein phosphatase 2A activator-like isoform X2 [Sitodiplosis mosellana]XP_055326178.1 serine/threonine-protein phosphatase 2A activator-like isoform X2 [Sitodiplosis mosellana]
MSEGEASTSYERKYVKPVPSVESMRDMALWKKSNAYYDIISFISMINEAVQGKKLSTKLIPSPIADNLLHIFDALNKMIDETPQTLGNQAYRDWFEKMRSDSTELLKKELPVIPHHALIEVSKYFIESFGNATRIDYGPSHELAFIMFLCALYKIHVLDESDNLCVGLKIFNAYLQVVRRLQLTYSMETAGSHGVSSMYDDQYLPFIWGSAQLCAKEPFEPNRSLETNVIRRFKNEYYVIGCIDHFRQVNTDSFAEYSNPLWSTSSVYSWVKINSILIENYEKELLAEFPVIQHVLFGSILELKEISVIDQIKKMKIEMKNEMKNEIKGMHQQLNKPTTIWEMISSQLRWTTISNKVSKLISGSKH